MSTRREDLCGISPEATTNAGLWLDKFIVNQTRADKESRRKLVKEVAGIDEPEDYDGYEHFYKQWEANLKRFGAICRKAEVLGRMVVGLGDESVLETSITLHHTYGVPYIPGSALKGLAAIFADQHAGNAWKKGSPAHAAVFGTSDAAGYITFFDALLVPRSGAGSQRKPLHADIITVHHEEYYQGKGGAPPADWDDPNPIPFLSATGKYLIALAAPKDCEEWIASAFKILAEALRYEGVGAKTSSGYGRMKLESMPIDPDQQQADYWISKVKAVPTNKLVAELGGYAGQLIKSQMTARHRSRVAQEILRRFGELDKKQQKKIREREEEKNWYLPLQKILQPKE